MLTTARPCVRSKDYCDYFRYLHKNSARVECKRRHYHPLLCLGLICSLGVFDSLLQHLLRCACFPLGFVWNGFVLVTFPPLFASCCSCCSWGYRVALITVCTPLPPNFTVRRLQLAWQCQVNGFTRFFLHNCSDFSGS